MTTPVQSKPMAEDKPDSNYGSYGLSLALTSLASAVRELAQSTQQYRLNCRLEQIEKKVEALMATQVELAADLQASVEQLKKTQGEIKAVQAATDTLKAKVKELEEIIANNPGAQAIAELVEAVAAVKAQTQVVDDEIPDPVPEGRPERQRR